MKKKPESERSIFLAALEIESLELRAEYLSQACGDNKQLRHEVDSLLAAHQADSRFLSLGDAPGQGVRSGELASQDVLLTEVLPNQAGSRPMIGRYKLLHQIGAGGMGVVYMAEQTDPVRRRVALKIIKPGMDSRAVIARFEAERQALAMMDHQNIARVLDAGTTESGRPYFVMELVKGVPITEFCDSNRFDPRQRLQLFIAVCRAIQHAHQKGIIHRDIKPSNVLVTLYDGEPAPKVIDFGVAKAINQRLTERTMFTIHGQIVGTLEYMSPEQAEMSALDVDTRSDIYSLGVLLYELLTGSTPVTGQQLRDAGFEEMLRLIRDQEPEKPSLRLSHSQAALPTISAQRRMEPQQLGALLRGDLDWIVMKALEKDRTRRYDNASALADDIERYLADEPVLARPPSAGYRLRKLVRKHRIAVVTTAIAALVLVAGLTLMTFLAVRAMRAEQLVATQRDLAHEAAANALAAQQREAQARRSAEVAQLAEANQKVLVLEQSQRLERQLYVHRVALARSEWLANNITTAEELLDACPPELRGWEWGYVHRLCAEHASTYRHAPAVPDKPRPVHAVAALSAATLEGNAGEGSLLVSAGGGMLKLWQSASDVAQLEQEISASARLSHDGLWAAWREPGGIRVWRVGASDPGSLISDVNWSMALAVAADGKQLAAADGVNVTIWDVDSGQQRIELHSPLLTPPGLQCIAFSPDGTQLAGGYSYANAAIWDTGSGELLLTLRSGPGSIESLAFSPDGKRLATAEFTGIARLWDLTTGAALTTFRGHSDAVRGVALSPDGERLATASQDRTVRLWDCATGEPLATLRGHRQGVRSVAFTPDGSAIVSGSQDGTMKLWNALGHQEAVVPIGHEDWAPCLAFREQGQQLVTLGFDQALRTWDSSRGTQLSEVSRRGVLAWLLSKPFLYRSSAVGGGGPHHDAATIIGAAFSSDGSTLATDTEEGIAVWNAADGRLLKQLGQPTDQAPVVALSSDGRRLAVAKTVPMFGDVQTQTSTLALWDVDLGEILWDHVDEGSFVSRLAFSPDNQLLAVAGSQFAQLWNVSDGDPVAQLELPPTSATTSIRFEPHSQRLAVGQTDGSVLLWDRSNNEPPLSIRTHESAVTALAFTPDAQRLATAGDDRSVKLWDLSMEQTTLSLPLSGKVTDLAFSPDGRRLAATTSSGAVRIWLTSAWDVD